MRVIGVMRMEAAESGHVTRDVRVICLETGEAVWAELLSARRLLAGHRQDFDGDFVVSAATLAWLCGRRLGGPRPEPRERTSGKASKGVLLSYAECACGRRYIRMAARQTQCVTCQRAAKWKHRDAGGHGR